MKLAFKIKYIMNNDFNISKYQALEGLCISQFQTDASFQITIHKGLFSNGDKLFYLTLEQLACNPSKPDYIEVETTTGGEFINLSMYNNSFNSYVNLSACNAYLATSDLNLIRINQPKTKYRVRTVFIPVIGKDGQLSTPIV